MTYNEGLGKLEVRIVDEEAKGDYLIMEEREGRNHGKADEETTSFCSSSSSSGSVKSGSRWCCIWWWAKLIVVVLFLGVLAAVFFKWVCPYFMDKEIIPILNWETRTFSPPVLAVLLFSSVALFPIILLPSTPSMWVAGMTFGYGFGFLLIIGAVTIGVSLPYFIGALFRHKMQEWLERYPKRASVIRLAGEGSQFDQFRAVTLIRISPFPYVVYNYLSLATNVKYAPYLLGSLAGMVPEIFVAIYTGIMIKTLADASADHRTLTAPQIIFNVLGFCLSLTTTIIVTIYAKKRLSELQKEENLLMH